MSDNSEDVLDPETVRRLTFTPYKAAQRVVERASAEIFDGVLLDAMTAGLIVSVYEQLGEDGKAKMDEMSVGRAGVIVWKIMERRR